MILKTLSIQYTNIYQYSCLQTQNFVKAPKNYKGTVKICLEITEICKRMLQVNMY